MFFFFKQKTSYEMRISDWSSDVCSSDLRNAGISASAPSATTSSRVPAATASRIRAAATSGDRPLSIALSLSPRTLPSALSALRLISVRTDPGATRSEEHTSELQSLKRISYAVFCFKKTIEHSTTTQNQQSRTY